MPRCQHCGSHVSHHYARVYEVDGSVRCCPHCRDRIRRNGRVHESRGARRTARDNENRLATDDRAATDGGQAQRTRGVWNGFE